MTPLPTTLMQGSWPSFNDGVQAMLMLAQQNQGGNSIDVDDSIAILMNVGMLIAAVAILVVSVVFLRKWLMPDDAGDPLTSQGQFTMAQLRKLRSDGLMNQEEFERARDALAARGKAILHNTQGTHDTPDNHDENDDDDGHDHDDEKT